MDPSAADQQVDPDAPVPEQSGERQWDVLVVVALGGILGAEGRIGIATVWPHSAGGFPWSTVVVNVLGCLLIGILMVVIGDLIAPHRLVRPFLGIGVLGGFTTFSTFAVDAEALIRAGRPVLALLYVLCTLAAGAAAVAGGIACTRLVARRSARLGRS